MGRRAHLPSLASRYPDAAEIRRRAVAPRPQRPLGVWHEVLAGPFTDFADLHAFMKALRGIAGVDRVSTRRFMPGMVRISVRYAGATPLATHLEPLRDMAPTMIAGTTRS